MGKARSFGRLFKEDNLTQRIEKVFGDIEEGWCFTIEYGEASQD